jgi:hypothetical protein
VARGGGSAGLSCTILPPGYRPPRRSSIPLKDRQRLAREYLVVIRIATVVLVLAAAATIVIIFVLIAPHM